MPVTAGVVRDTREVALATAFEMAAQGGGAANFNRPHHAPLRERQRVRGAIGWAVFSKDVRQLQGWPRHGGFTFCAAVRASDDPAGWGFRRPPARPLAYSARWCRCGCGPARPE